MFQFSNLLVDSVWSGKVSFEGDTAHAKSNVFQGLGGFSVCLSLPKWLPGFGVEEECVQDGCDQGDGEDGVEQVDLLHDGQVGETVLLLKTF